MKTPAVVLALLLIAAPCLAQTFTLDAVANCPDFPDGYTITLTGGTYNIEWVSGAWSPIADDAIYGGYGWRSQVYLYVYATAQTGIIGSPSIPGYYTSPALAEAAARGIYTLIIPTNSVVQFWLPEVVNNFNDCSDNRGSVTLRFVAPLVTEPTTWGRIKSLYR